jgi:putative NADPH-quinone reductase
MNVLVIHGHPRRNSLSETLADAFAEGACSAAANVKRLILMELCFERDVVEEPPCTQTMGADLRRAKTLIRWADHLVFVYPTWWGHRARPPEELPRPRAHFRIRLPRGGRQHRL